MDIAATCLAILVAGAVAVHLRRGEQSAIAMPLALLAAAVFVAFGRFGSWWFQSDWFDTESLELIPDMS